MTDKEKEKLIAKFLRLTKSKGFLRIEEIVARLDAGDFWNDEFLENAMFEAKKNYARSMAQKVKDKDGNRILLSIEQITSEGEKQRVYKQERLFDVEDYKQASAYHMNCAKHHLSEAERMQKKCLERYNVQFDLPFSSDGSAVRAKRSKVNKTRKRISPEANA